MSGMDFEFHVGVSGTGELEAAAAAARDFEHAMDGARDADLEFAASADGAAAGAAAQAAAMEAAAQSAGTHLDAQGKLRDEMGRFVSATTAVDRSVRGLGDSFKEQQRSQDDVGRSMADLEKAGKDLGRSSELASLTAGNGMSDFRFKVEDAHKAVADAERGIDDLQNATSRSEVASISAAHGLKDLEKGGKDAGRAISDLDGAASAASSAGGGLGEMGSVLGPAALPAAIGGLVVAAAAAAPALIATGLGAGAMAALAYPALSKVSKGLSDVSSAQDTYTKAKARAQVDPTKANLAAEQRALVSLKATYAAMPPPVRQAVAAVHQLESAWDQASRSSGVQQAALRDTTKVLHLAKDAIPSVVTLAKAAEKPISGMLTALDRGIKSSGFRSFIRDMAREEKPAVKSLTGLGGAILGFAGNTLKKLAPISPKFINSLTKLTHAFGPGVTNGLAAAAGDLTKIDDALASKGSLSMIHGLEGLGKQSFGGLTSLATGMTQLGTALHLLGKDTAGRSTFSKIMNDVNKYAPGNGSNIVTKSMGLALNPAGAIIQGIEKRFRSGGGVSGKAFHVPITVIPDVKSKGGGGIASIIQSSVAKAAAAAKGGTVRVKPKIDPGDVAGQISKATAGKDIPVKGKVTLSGLGAGIQSQIAHLHIPDSHVKISVQVSGIGAAKASMAGVVAAARSDAAGAKSALGSLGPAGSAAGAALSAGLAAGIKAGEGAVVAAATAVAGAAAAAVRAAAAIHSPSRVWHGLGQSMVQGLLLALQGGKAEVAAAARAITGAAKPFTDPKIAATFRQLHKEVEQAFKGHGIGLGQKMQLTALLDMDNIQLTKLAKRRAQLLGQIKAADALAKSVRQGAISSADITGIASADTAGQQAAANAPSAPGSIIDGQKQALHNIRAFRADIIKLKKEGLDKTSIKQLLAAGVSGGLPAAEQLLASGKKGVKESAKLQKQILAASKALGITGANAAYESASEIGKGLAAGLKAQLKPVTQAIEAIARALIKTLEKELGIKPGKGGLAGLLGLGGSAGGGGGHGHGHGGGGHEKYRPGGGHLFDGAGHHKGHLPVMHPGYVTTGGASGGGRAPVQVHVTVHVTNTIDGMGLASGVQQAQLRHARRNIATGVKLAGRGV